MNQKINVGRKVYIDFYDGGNVTGFITLIGTMSTGDGLEKVYQLKVAEDSCINVCESQIEEIYDAYSLDNYEEFLEYLSEKYLLEKLNPIDHRAWLPIVWNMLDEEEKAQLTVFFSSREVVVSAMDIIFNFEREVKAIMNQNHGKTPKKKEDVISQFYSNTKKNKSLWSFPAGRN